MLWRNTRCPSQLPATTLIATLILSFVCVVPLKAQQDVGKAEDDSDGISSKMNEMRTTAQKLVELRYQAFQHGNIDFREALRAQHQLLEVELQCATSPDDRSKALAENLKKARYAERIATAAFKNGSMQEGDLFDARLARMQIEILMLDR